MDKAVDLLKLLRGNGKSGGTASYGGSVITGLRIIRAVTTDPNPITFVFEGTELALDLGVFEVPISLYPIRVGDKFFTYPIVGDNTQRWAVVEKINGGAVVGTMQSATTCQVNGIGRAYTSADLIVPAFVPIDSDATRPLQAGDSVLLLPVLVGTAIKYAITQKF